MTASTPTPEKKHLVIAAAGTGGHVMPGLAVAAVMKARGWKISWIGTTTGMEGGLVSKRGIDFRGLNFQGMRGRGLVKLVVGGFKLLGAIWRARAWMKELHPDAVFSTGGYVAVPVGYAAQTLRRPIILMNCDADLLMSTNTLMPFCDALACGFAGGARTFAGEKGRTTGNPVRAEIAALPPPAERFAGRTGPIRVFVFGGSLGAQVLNDVIPEALSKIPADRRPLVLHQTGRNRDDAVRARYKALGVDAKVVPFIDDMAKCYRESDLVICRAGATSASEICAAGAAAVLVPFIAKTTKHQLGNAKYLADRGAAILVEQKDFTVEKAAELLEKTDRAELLRIAEAARSIAAPRAAEAVADLIEDVVRRRAGLPPLHDDKTQQPTAADAGR